MVMSWIFAGLLLTSLVFSWLTGQAGQLAGAAMQGAQEGVNLILSMAGAICLWSGVGDLMEHIGVTEGLSRLLEPLLHRIFPSTRTNSRLRSDLSANICANILGLGNAATPMGIRAAKQMARGDTAPDELCRLVVLNTASIQLIPTNVAALRTSLGCGTPFDILPAVWITSLCSAGLGLAAAWVLGRVWKK